MKKLMSLLLSSVLCLSLTMPTVAFGADDNITELLIIMWLVFSFHHKNKMILQKGVTKYGF